MVEEEFIAFAKIAFFPEIILIKWGTIFHAAASTNCQMPADKTFVTNIFFGLGEGSLLAACSQFFYRCIKDVAQLPSWLDKKITAECVTIMFDNNILTALLVECANCMFSRDEI